jgi:hypothetical protein
MTLSLFSLSASAQTTGNIKRVLLISVDGMHAVDFKNCAAGINAANAGSPYCPAIAALGKTGVNYVAASASKPSDSFPGLTAIITGASPALTGVYYDVAYSRNYDAPAKTTGNGSQAAPALPASLQKEQRLSTRKASTTTKPSLTAELPELRSPTAESHPSIRSG